VQAFLDDLVGFSDIPVMLEAAVDQHPWTESPDLDTLDDLSAWVSHFIGEKVPATARV